MIRRRTISVISYLTGLALYTLMVLTIRCEHLQAQNTKSDLTLNRLVQAVKAIDQQQFQEAENLLNSVLATVPNDGDANNLLGVVRAKAVRAVFSAPEVQYMRVDKPAKFWGLSGSASLNGKQLTLTVTNPHLSEIRDAEIAVRGARPAEVRVLAMPDVHAHNTFDNPGVVQPRNETAALTGGTISYRFPPASVTRLQITVA